MSLGANESLLLDSLIKEAVARCVCVCNPAVRLERKSLFTFFPGINVNQVDPEI